LITAFVREFLTGQGIFSRRQRTQDRQAWAGSAMGGSGDGIMPRSIVAKPARRPAPE